MKTIEITNIPIRMNEGELEQEVKAVDAAANTSFINDQGHTTTPRDEEGNELPPEIFPPKIEIVTDSSEPDGSFISAVASHNPQKTDKENQDDNEKENMGQRKWYQEILEELQDHKDRITALEP